MTRIFCNGVCGGRELGQGLPAGPDRYQRNHVTYTHVKMGLTVELRPPSITTKKAYCRDCMRRVIDEGVEK